MIRTFAMTALMLLGAVWILEQAGGEASGWTVTIVFAASSIITYIAMNDRDTMNITTNEITKILEENARLKAFAAELLANFPMYKSVDSEVALELAVKHGLMTSTQVTEPCHGGDPDAYCACDEAGLFDQTSSGKVTCYKTSNILRSGA